MRVRPVSGIRLVSGPSSIIGTSDRYTFAV